MKGSPDDFLLKIPEPQRSGFLFLRHFFTVDSGLQEAWKFHTPFYYFKGKWFAFISYNAKKDHEIYISFVRGHMVSHPGLLSEGRKQQKIYRIASDEDIDAEALGQIVGMLKGCY